MISAENDKGIPTRGCYSGQSYKIFDEYNDVHIFVEDAGFENLYKILFRNNGINTKHIFALTGKRSVITKAENCNDSKCVYIVDRDWDYFFKPEKKLKNLITLEMYSIESYLINYNSFAGIIIGDNPKIDIDKSFSMEYFQKSINEIFLSLKPLFECFLSLADNNLKGASHKPGKFSQKNRTLAPCEIEIERFISESGIEIHPRVNTFFARDEILIIGHGKYMMHFIWQKIKNEFNLKQMDIDCLMIRLAQLLKSPDWVKIVNRVKIICNLS